METDARGAVLPSCGLGPDSDVDVGSGGLLSFTDSWKVGMQVSLLSNCHGIPYFLWEMGMGPSRGGEREMDN